MAPRALLRKLSCWGEKKTVAEIVYMLCALTSILCVWLLLRANAKNPTPLLFWSSACFAGLALNNVMLVVDLILVPTVDLTIARIGIAMFAFIALLFGLIREVQ